MTDVRLRWCLAAIVLPGVSAKEVCVTLVRTVTSLLLARAQLATQKRSLPHGLPCPSQASREVKIVTRRMRAQEARACH